MSEQNLNNLQPTENYDENQIQVLKGLEAVRKRPGMYIGSTGERGLHHLVYEIVDNAIDESLAGFCTHIEVDILEGDIIRVKDNGRGIPTAPHPVEKISTLLVVYTMLHAGGKFGGGGYKVSGGLHGVGASVVNALSEWLEVEVHDGKKIHKARFEKGETIGDVEIIGDTDRTGTTVTFKPDPEIFTDTTVFDYDILLTRLREQAFLNAGVKITLTDNRSEVLGVAQETKKEQVFYEGGIKSYVDFMMGKQKKDALINDVIYLFAEDGDSTAEIAFKFNTGYDSKIVSFANCMHTVDGGTHENAFKTSLTKVINNYARKFKLLKENDQNLKGDDVQEGLIAIISVKLVDAQFESQTKAKLGNTAIGTLVTRLMNEKLMDYLEDNPSVAKIIISKCIAASNAREAAQKARDLQRKQASTGKLKMPEKLADCISKNPEETEIFIVEGDSAGGSAIKGRDSRTQAILPLWGKMLNVEKSGPDKVYGNDKLTPVIIALGTGIGDDFDISKLRYGKIFIMADADVDGAHIRTLLLTFFFRHMPKLIEEGHIYCAQPPLFKVSKGKTVYYAFSDEERDIYIEKLGGNADIQRYKGLGEMDGDQLWETTMNPDFRTTVKITMNDAEKADEVFRVLMGDEVEPRKRFIEENAQFVQNLDI